MSTLSSHEREQIKKMVKEAIQEMLPQIADAVVERLHDDNKGDEEAREESD